MSKRTIVVYSPARFADEVFLPTLWSQAKTYYERHGTRTHEWEWAPCFADAHADDISAVQTLLSKLRPDVFAVSLYVWNYWIAHGIAAWVKEQWPHCFVITGGPHQYLSHDINWFRDHSYIDASLPGDCFGELCLQQVLDNLDQNGSLNHDQVQDLWYPTGKTRRPGRSIKTQNRLSRKLFDYDWSSYADQRTGIDQFIAYVKQHNPQSKVLAVLETTRGCPYACTYCDWGGGINTTVIKKNMSVLIPDIEYLCSIDLKYLYLADANFGIFGDRDISIIKQIRDSKLKHASKVRLGYGGFAKTENRLPYIRDILQIDIANNLSNSEEIKISMQSLDHEVLTNIDRKNIDLEQQLTAFSSLGDPDPPPIFVEMILGLPGMTLAKFYHELDILGRHSLSVLWYEWILLPETPAYDRSYREKFDISTVIKSQGWSIPQHGGQHEIVIKSYSYTQENYLEMLLATSWYHAMVRGGLLSNSWAWLRDQRSMQHGDFIQTLMAELGLVKDLHAVWQDILNNRDRSATLEFNGMAIYLGYFVPAMIYFDSDKILPVLHNVLTSQYAVPEPLIMQDIYEVKKTIQQRKWTDIHQDFWLYRNSGHILQSRSWGKRLQRIGMTVLRFLSPTWSRVANPLQI